MLLFVRIALMWLLALAVPAQGFAAASMLNCGPGHHGALKVHAHDHGPGEATQHSHDNAGHVDWHAQGFAERSTDGAEAPAAHGVVKVSCSACASCCTAAALPTAAVTFDAAPVDDFMVQLASRSIAAFLTDGPERPPRTILM
jgi:hypothetical protein